MKAVWEAWKEMLCYWTKCLKHKLCGFPPCDTKWCIGPHRSIPSDSRDISRKEAHLVAPGTSWQTSMSHLKEIQLGPWLNECIRSQRKYFPALLLISWLTAKRTGISKIHLMVECPLYAAQEIVPVPLQSLNLWGRREEGRYWCLSFPHVASLYLLNQHVCNAQIHVQEAIYVKGLLKILAENIGEVNSRFSH